jgi:hypothetical protein
MSSTRKISNKFRSLRNTRPTFATIVDIPGIMQIRARTLRRQVPAAKSAPGAAKGNHGKKMIFQVEQGHLNFMGNISI